VAADDLDGGHGLLGRKGTCQFLLLSLLELNLAHKLSNHLVGRLSLIADVAGLRPKILYDFLSPLYSLLQFNLLNFQFFHAF